MTPYPISYLQNHGHLFITVFQILSEIDNLVSVKSTKIPDYKIEYSRNHEEPQLELAKENEFLQMALNNATFELNAKVNYCLRYNYGCF